MSSAASSERLGSLGLELHPDKTKVVYCKDTKRRGSYEHTSFDFPGYDDIGITWATPFGHAERAADGDSS
ncbi:MAG: hypothetical protein ACYCS7_07595 [Acidimicrobiales bacterium]